MRKYTPQEGDDKTSTTFWFLDDPRDYEWIFSGELLHGKDGQLEFCGWQLSWFFSTVRLGLGGCRVELTVGSVVSGYVNQECLIGFYWVLFVFRFMVVH